MNNDYVLIKNICNIRRGASPRPINDPIYFGGNVGWVRISDVTSSKKFLNKTEQYVSKLGESKSVRVDRGDLILSICGTIGKPIIVNIPACIHDGFVKLYDINNADSEYLYYALQFSEDKLIAMGQPGTQVNVNTTIVGNLKVFLPSMEEQNKITRILSTVDESIRKTEQLISKYKNMKQGLMCDLFTRGIYPDGRTRPSSIEEPTKYKHTSLGNVPKEWNIKTLGEVCTIVSGGTPDRSHPEYWEGGTIPWVTPSDITSNNKRTIRETKEYITEEGLKNSSAKLVPAGSLLMTSRATIGEIKINEIDMCTNQGFKTLIPYKDIDNWFLYYQMNFLKQKYENYGSGSTFLEVSKKDTENFAIIVPSSVEEQMKVRDILINIDKSIEDNQQIIKKYNEIKLGVMQDLLTGKVRVKVEGDGDE